MVFVCDRISVSGTLDCVPLAVNPSMKFFNAVLSKCEVWVGSVSEKKVFMYNIKLRPQGLAYFLVYKFNKNQIIKIPDFLLRPGTIRPFGQSPFQSL